MTQKINRNLWFLILGVAGGLFLGPLGLGQIAPEVYQRIFTGQGSLQQQKDLDQFDQEMTQRMQQLEATGVTHTALEEYTQQQMSKRHQLEAKVLLIQQQQVGRLHGMTSALILALIVVMAVETLLPHRSYVRRLATARYVVIAIWITLVLAEPKMLDNVHIVFATLLALVALGVALVPLKTPLVNKATSV